MCTLIFASFLYLAFALSAFFNPSSLQARDSWGKTGKIHEYHGAKWDEAYYKVKGLHFTASIPNYLGVQLRNDIAAIEGKIDTVAGYAIHMVTKNDFIAQKDGAKYVKIVQQANVNHTVTLINSQKNGASYGVDLIPKNDKNKGYWRFLVYKGRIVRMGTDDPDAARRNHFFDSIKIK